MVVSLTISGRILPFDADHPMCGLMFHQLGKLEAAGSLWGGHGADHEALSQIEVCYIMKVLNLFDIG